jgi:hypothetical protein
VKPLPPPPLFARVVWPVSLAKVTFPAETPGPGNNGPNRRVAGLLWNDQVWALYESDGQTSVVKPGDIVEGGTVRAITDEGLILDVPTEEKPVVVPLVRGVTFPSSTGARPGLGPNSPYGVRYPAPGESPAVPQL